MLVSRVGIAHDEPEERRRVTEAGPDQPTRVKRGLVSLNFASWNQTAVATGRGFASTRCLSPFVAANAVGQRCAFARRRAPIPVVEGRPPRRPFLRDARVLLALRCAPTKAATPTMSTFLFPRSEQRATRTRASGRVVGCASRNAVNTSRMARSAFAAVSAAAYTGSPGT